MEFIARKVVMVRPRSFRSNEETLASNAFQKKGDFQNEILQAAQSEFDQLKNLLILHGIEVSAFEEPIAFDTPDALFPNNWFATFPDGKVFTFPMEAINRRREYRSDILAATGAALKNIIDLRILAESGHFLEGTGSLIMDHRNKTAYACLSSRTTETALREFKTRSGYEIISFSAVDESAIPFYHTNVILSLGEKSAILFADGILNRDERNTIIARIEASGRAIVFLNTRQVESFAGNMLLLQNLKGEKFWVCSHRAEKSLSLAQKQILNRDGFLLSSSIDTIENIGGGSVRCMLAEIF